MLFLNVHCYRVESTAPVLSTTAAPGTSTLSIGKWISEGLMPIASGDMMTGLVKQAKMVKYNCISKIRCLKFLFGHRKFFGHCCLNGCW